MTRSRKLDITATTRPRHIPSTVAAGLLVMGLAFSPAASAQGAVTVGQTFDPGTSSCGAGGTILQSVSPPAANYTVPARGVITSWAFQGGATPSEIKLKVADPEGANGFQTVGESRVEVAAAGIANSFPARISVHAGDVIGLTPTVTGPCIRSAAAGFSYSYFNGDPPDDAVATYNPPLAGVQVDVAAQLEPDVDRDGFGDESQDLCPTDAETHRSCAIADSDPPETSISKRPRNRSPKRKVSYRFNSGESGATFECSVDREPFSACTAPLKLKMKTGKHAFSVRAVDLAGNADPTPATDRFKVVG